MPAAPGRTGHSQFGIHRRRSLLDRQRYVISDSFYSLIARNGSNPVLIVDDPNSPSRVFLVKYVVGAVGENARLIFKNELTGYDFEQQMIYPTQTMHLDKLQNLLESAIYGSDPTRMARFEIENSMNQRVATKVIVSKDLVSAIIDLYQFAW